jgi:GMP synthase-like glutamine amidotransferase
MLVFIQNDPEVPAGSYGDLLRGARVPFRIVRPYADEVLPRGAEVDATIVLGGAMGVHDTEKHPFLRGVREFIRECVREGKPFLGICLGGQLLADVVGARVHSGRWGERGGSVVELTAEGVCDPLFEGAGREFITFQWHDDSFDLPAGCTRLAFSAACPNQAFRCGENAYGIQFHPEVDREIVASWARDTMETAPAADAFIAGFVSSEESFRQASRLLLSNFLLIANLYP